MRKGPIPLSRLIVRTLILCLAVTLGSAGPAQASWLVPPPFIRAKDFAVLKHDGLYHVFYIRHNNQLPDPQTETDLGHATSPDLYNWTHHPPVLPRVPGAWDRSHIWAPHIIKRDSVYFMFYTGVANDPGGPRLFQRTGLATSTDLFQWVPYPGPIFGCHQTPWVFCDSMVSASAFRDPFLMPDPAVPGDWLMLNSTSPAIDSLGMIVGVARSHGDFTQWQDEKPLWITHHWQTGEWQTESAHMFARNGLWYLLFTTGGSQPLSFATGLDPLGEPSAWTYRGRLSNMLGVNTGAWFASEQLKDGIVDYFCYVNGDRIEFQRMVWGPDWQFHLTAPDPFHVVRMEWSTPAVADSDSVSLAVSSTFAYGKQLVVDAVVTFTDSTTETFGQESIGLPDVLSLQSPLTTFHWSFSAPRGSVSGAWPVSIVLRTRDETCESRPLAVAPEDTVVVEPPPPPLPDPGHGGDEGPDDTGMIRPMFRAVRGAPVAGTALLVDLPAAAESRVEVFDVQGRRVRTLARGMLPAGANVLSWDGRDEAGVRAANGLYFARLATGGHVYSVTIVLR